MSLDEQWWLRYPVMCRGSDSVFDPFCCCLIRGGSNRRQNDQHYEPHQPAPASGPSYQGGMNFMSAHLVLL